jgi:hypothetical protein
MADGGANARGEDALPSRHPAQAELLRLEAQLAVCVSSPRSHRALAKQGQHGTHHLPSGVHLELDVEGEALHPTEEADRGKPSSFARGSFQKLLLRARGTSAHHFPEATLEVGHLRAKRRRSRGACACNGATHGFEERQQLEPRNAMRFIERGHNAEDVKELGHRGASMSVGKSRARVRNVRR